MVEAQKRKVRNAVEVIGAEAHHAAKASDTVMRMTLKLRRRYAPKHLPERLTPVRSALHA